MFEITEEITIKDVDEAISHVYAMLKDDRYGNRLTHQRKELLRSSIDDLLDARIGIRHKE